MDQGTTDLIVQIVGMILAFITGRLRRKQKEN